MKTADWFALLNLFFPLLFTSWIVVFPIRVLYGLLFFILSLLFVLELAIFLVLLVVSDLKEFVRRSSL